MVSHHGLALCSGGPGPLRQKASSCSLLLCLLGPSSLGHWYVLEEDQQVHAQVRECTHNPTVSNIFTLRAIGPACCLRIGRHFFLAQKRHFPLSNSIDMTIVILSFPLYINVLISFSDATLKNAYINAKCRIWDCSANYNRCIGSSQREGVCLFH